MEDENCDGDRSGVNQDFLTFYKENISLKIETLPLSEKSQLPWVQKEISFVLAWINDFLKEAKKEKQIFMEDSCFDIVPEEYNFEYDEKEKKVNLKFVFIVDEEDMEELRVSGSLVKSKENKVGIDWSKEEGNTFWLSSIIRSLNEQLKVLA